MSCPSGSVERWGAHGGSLLPPCPDEWERYCAQVSDWDVKEYLDVLP
jgi:hypothetical protein